MSGENGQPAETPGKQVARRPDRTPLMRRDPIQLAGQFIASGLFKGMDLPKAVVKIVAGEELGIGPMASMTGVHIIEGKPSLSANLLAVQVKRSEKYDYRVLEEDDKHVKLVWLSEGEEIGTSEFTVNQAKKADLLSKKNWERYLEDMLFSRALTRGVRRHCPEVTAGTPAYTPEELGAEVNAEGEPIYVESTVEPATEPEPVALDPQKVAHLIEGIEIVRPTLAEEGVNWLDGLNVRLGKLGIDAFDPLTETDVCLSKLSPEDAEKLDAELQAMAEQQDGEPIDAEEVASDAA